MLRSVWDQLQGQDAQLAKGQPPQPGPQEREFAGRVSKQGEGCHHFDVVDSVGTVVQELLLSSSKIHQDSVFVQVS